MKHADKTAILKALTQRISQALEALIASQKTVQSGAVHEETRQEDPKDTRAIEASYLARGLAERVETLREARAALATLRLREFGPEDEVGLTALVCLRDDEDRESIYFLVPVGGGERLTIDGATVHTLTPHSPLGSAIVERSAGEEVEVYLPRAAGAGGVGANNAPTFLYLAWVK